MFSGKFVHGWLYKDISGTIYKYIGETLEKETYTVTKHHIIKVDENYLNDIVSDIALRKNTLGVHAANRSDSQVIQGLSQDKIDLLETLEFIGKLASKYDDYGYSAIAQVVDKTIQQIYIRNKQ